MNGSAHRIHSDSWGKRLWDGKCLGDVGWPKRNGVDYWPSLWHFQTEYSGWWLQNFHFLSGKWILYTCLVRLLKEFEVLHPKSWHRAWNVVVAQQVIIFVITQDQLPYLPMIKLRGSQLAHVHTNTSSRTGGESMTQDLHVPFSKVVPSRFKFQLCHSVSYIILGIN